ncbi:MAG: dTMP kinase [Opitutales bacterium]
MFITLEGPEGSGKSTQLQRLQTRLEAAGHTVVALREPGGTELGEAIRNLLKTRAMCAEAELLLFAASRAQLVREVIEPALDAGKVVLCDRFLDSTTVYQGAARALPAESVERVSTVAASDCRPSLTLVLDLPVAESFRRIEARGELDRFEQAGQAFHEAVRRGYHELAAREPERVRLLDGQQSADTLEAAIWEHVCEHLNRPD